MAPDSDNEDDQDSDGIPRLPPPPAIRSAPADATLPSFVLAMPSTLPPDAATSAVVLPSFAEGTRDGADQRVEAIADDAPTGLVTPLDVGYRYAILRKLVELVNTGGGEWQPLRAHGDQLGATVFVDPQDKSVVVVAIRRWRDFAAWVRAHALDDFVVLRSSMATWPDEIRIGARSVLRRLNEACYQKPVADPCGNVFLRL